MSRAVVDRIIHTKVKLTIIIATVAIIIIWM